MTLCKVTYGHIERAALLTHRNITPKLVYTRTNPKPKILFTHTNPKLNLDLLYIRNQNLTFMYTQKSNLTFIYTRKTQMQSLTLILHTHTHSLTQSTWCITFSLLAALTLHSLTVT